MKVKLTALRVNSHLAQVAIQRIAVFVDTKMICKTIEGRLAYARCLITGLTNIVKSSAIRRDNFPHIEPESPRKQSAVKTSLAEWPYHSSP
jgi:hypothetical protein